MPKVSVVIPTYSRSEFLQSAIMSVTNQTFQDIEVIVVDDASSDKSAEEIVSGFNDVRIKYIRHEVNKGLSAARNTGLKASSGKYIALLDDDDEWLPEKLQMQFDLLEKNPPKVGIIYTGDLKIDRASGRVLQQEIPNKRGDLYNDLMIKDCIFAGGSSALIRRECFKKVGFFDETLPSMEAYDMWIRLSRVFHFDYIDKPLVKYFYHGSRINTNFKILIEGIEMILKRYGHLFNLSKEGGSYYYFSLGVLYCLNGDTKKGRNLLLKATKLNPFEIRHFFNLGLSLLGANAFKTLKETKEKVVTSLGNIKFGN